MTDSYSTHSDITFSFGENFAAFLDHLTDTQIREAVRDMGKWIGRENITGRTVLDIGCGSGLHSLAFHFCGAKSILAFDADPKSVATTQRLWNMAGKPMHWAITQGSVLDPDFMKSIPTHDIVYAWGVLHHTGKLWEAMASAASKVKLGGLFWFSLYTKGPRYSRDLALKKRYNTASRFRKNLMESRFIFRFMRQRLARGENPFGWNHTKRRGMNVYHDIVDWLGGLPYEVASPEEVQTFMAEHGFTPKKIEIRAETDTSVYLYKKET